MHRFANQFRVRHYLNAGHASWARPVTRFMGIPARSSHNKYALDVFKDRYEYGHYNISRRSSRFPSFWRFSAGYRFKINTSDS